MNPYKLREIYKYLTRAKKTQPDLPDVFSASKAPIPAKTQNVQETEAVNRFIRANPRKDMAGGGMLVQPGFGGTRQGYRSDKAIKAAQQAGNVAKQKARFDKIGKAFIKQDYNALKTLTRPARIAAGAKDAGGILNQADTSLLNNVILGNDVNENIEIICAISEVF